MTLGPEDVVRKTFSPARFRGGYLVEEVDGFLEEVVASLRRLHSTVDEQRAHIQTLTAGGGTTTHDLEVETDQLAQVRRERDAVVAELTQADQRLASARAEAARAEESRTASLAEVRQRFDEDLLRLEATVEQARARAQHVQQESRQQIAAAREEAAAAQQQTETLRAQVARLSAEVRAAAVEHLGESTVAELVPVSDTSQDPIRQAAAMTLLAERLRTDHVASGAAEAARLITEGQRHHDALVSQGQQTLEQAQTEAAGALAVARAEGEQVKELARRSGERLLAQAQQTRDAQLAEAQSRASRLVEDAELERDAIMAELSTRRETLEARVAALESSHRAYRQRLHRLISEQLATVEADQWDRELPALQG